MTLDPFIKFTVRFKIHDHYLEETVFQMIKYI